ncbi:hypothetical protein CM15mP43_11030 [bacterium]|nr:MAG: hypothetical protein CM15mP43_11030 [bacterium]
MLLHKINEGIINIKKDKIKKLIKNLLEVLPDGIGLDKVLGFFLSIFPVGISIKNKCYIPCTETSDCNK